MRQRRALAEINVVPYIDVMLVLLVIFMATAPLLMQGVEVQLPQTASRTECPRRAWRSPLPCQTCGLDLPSTASCASKAAAPCLATLW